MYTLNMDNKQREIRLNEIFYCMFFQKLLHDNKNPIKVYNLIESVANVTNANLLIINNVTNIILNNDRRYMPQREEYIYALVHSNMPARKVYKFAHISASTYQAFKHKEMVITARFSPEQYKEMLKILDFFNTAYKNLGGILHEC